MNRPKSISVVIPRFNEEAALASRAADLFEKQPAGEKRRLLDFVRSNCTWVDGVLTPEFRQPFDMIAVEAAAGAKEKVAGVVSGDLLQNRLPG